VLRAACCVLRAACCVLRAACCVLRAACCVLLCCVLLCCVLRAACCVLLCCVLLCCVLLCCCAACCVLLCCVLRAACCCAACCVLRAHDGVAVYCVWRPQLAGRQDQLEACIAALNTLLVAIAVEVGKGSERWDGQERSAPSPRPVDRERPPAHADHDRRGTMAVTSSAPFAPRAVPQASASPYTHGGGPDDSSIAKSSPRGPSKGAGNVPLGSPSGVGGTHSTTPHAAGGKQDHSVVSPRGWPAGPQSPVPVPPDHWDRGEGRDFSRDREASVGLRSPSHHPPPRAPLPLPPAPVLAQARLPVLSPRHRASRPNRFVITRRALEGLAAPTRAPTPPPLTKAVGAGSGRGTEVATGHG
jgi:hypothetical protein